MMTVAMWNTTITKFEKIGSLPRVILLAFHPRNILAMIKGFRLPTLASLRGISLAGIPKTFLVLNVFMVSIYAIGVLSSLFAGAQIPTYRVTATQLSGIVNGIATVLLVLMVSIVILVTRLSRNS